MEHAIAQEGYIYGEGTGLLIERIKIALRAVPGSFPKDAKLCAQAIHKVLCNFAHNVFDHNPDYEVFMRTEGEEGRRTYMVSYEAGPYEWAIPASFAVMDCTGRLCEPYYSFDLCLYDVE